MAKKDDGITLLEVMLAMSVILMTLATFSYLSSWSQKKVQAEGIANQMIIISDAMAEYTRDNYSTLITTATDTNAVVVSVADLKAGGFLDGGYSERNGLNQLYTGYVLQPITGRLKSLILTSGGSTSMSKKYIASHISEIAARMGARGGYIPMAGTSLTVPDTIYGSFAGWSLLLTGTNIPNTGGGHLAALSVFSPLNTNQDFLYRVEVAGRPELNQMVTSIDMTDNKISRVGEVQFTKHENLPADFCVTADDEGKMIYKEKEGLHLCKNGKIETMADTGNTALLVGSSVSYHGQKFTKPKCPVESGTVPKIFVSTAIIAEGAISKPLAAVQSWATDMGTEWMINLRVKTDEDAGFINPDPNYGRVNVQILCSKDIIIP